MSFSTKAIKYFTNLKSPIRIIEGISAINPYESDEVKSKLKQFFIKYYNDNNERLFIIGINPGRFGGGLTGISFTDPVALKEYCGIDNNLGDRKELSSKFIYQMIELYGGAESFYSNIFISALYPFAIIKNDKNYNYYDEKSLAEKLKKEIISNMKLQIEFGARRDRVILLGKKNADYFSSINKEYNFFKSIVVLEHPRYIMQYKLKHIHTYLKKYIDSIN